MIIALFLIAGCGSADGLGTAEPPAPLPRPATEPSSTTAAPDAQEQPEPSVQSEAPRRFEFTSYKELEPLMEELGYTPETWQAGIREVPRIYVTDIPPRWRDRVSKEVSVQVKKRIFFRLLAPLALRSNELILDDRRRAEQLILGLKRGESISGEDDAWLTRLAVGYGAVKDEDKLLDTAAYDELLNRVDVVPISLALSQAAEESGWGTSRFAAEGNALFGQWSWGGKGMKPKNQRSDLGDHRIASFEAPLQSVMAYMHNLNTHRAYRELRTSRAAMRRDGERLRGWQLATTLNNYSERGEAYVESLHAIMRVNQLDPADDAFLGDGATIHLVPVGSGTK